jgi:hypothetical protein
MAFGIKLNKEEPVKYKTYNPSDRSGKDHAHPTPKPEYYPTSRDLEVLEKAKTENKDG